jgi:hypothetical protein
MGHCPVLDYKARTEWHIPLRENVHYLSLDVPPEETIAPAEFARRMMERIEGWLSAKELISSVAENAAAYFDENLAPARLGRYLVEQSKKRLAPGTPANTACRIEHEFIARRVDCGADMNQTNYIAGFRDRLQATARASATRARISLPPPKLFRLDTVYPPNQ